MGHSTQQVSDAAARQRLARALRPRSVPSVQERALRGLRGPGVGVAGVPGRPRSTPQQLNGSSTKELISQAAAQDFTAADHPDPGLPRPTPPFAKSTAPNRYGRARPRSASFHRLSRVTWAGRRPRRNLRVASGRGDLAVCGCPRPGLGLQIVGGRHDEHDRPAVPARRDDAGPARGRPLPGQVHRADPQAVRLPAAPLVHLVRNQRPGPLVGLQRPTSSSTSATSTTMVYATPRSTPGCTPSTASSGSPTFTA